MNAEEYETLARVENAHWWYRGLRAMLRQAWATDGVSEDAALLDLGCGTGATLSAFDHLAMPIGLDVSPLATAMCARRGLRRLVQGAAQDLPFPDETFDVVFLLDVLYHRGVPNKVDALREAGRVLKPGGTVYVNVPAYQWLYSSHDRAIHTDRRFTRRELVSMLNEAKLQTVRATYWNALLLPPIVLVRLWWKWKPRQGSDLTDSGDGIVTNLYTAGLAVERLLLRVIPLPAGLSIFAVARKAL
ncbi:MAG: class I SAM-dependent methyltransferase [Candidatus Hydrogenedentes bacterium]|nr:class I SAM-dependent methyltransferase [Candidatus Hydrogenedentota bacterium]